jgi:hypothetical protein
MMKCRTLEIGLVIKWTREGENIMAQQAQSGRMLPMTAQPSQLIAAYQLGSVVREFKSSSVSKRLLGIGILMLGVVLILVCILFLVAVKFDLRLIVLLLFGISLILYSKSVIGAAARNRGAQVFLCTNGVMRLQGGQAETIHWNQIAAVRKTFTELSARGQKSYFLKQCILQSPNGTALMLDNAFGGFKELVGAIEQQVTQYLLPGAIAAYTSGRPVDFEKVSVSYQGLSVHNGQKTLPWNELKTVKVRNGLIEIKKTGSLLDWEIIHTEGMPNTCVLAALIGHITGGQKLSISKW